MTSHRDSTDTQFQASIDGLSHTSIPTKLAVIESLDAPKAPLWKRSATNYTSINKKLPFG